MNISSVIQIRCTAYVHKKKYKQIANNFFDHNNADGTGTYRLAVEGY
jgi:hypothetical protein